MQFAEIIGLSLSGSSDLLQSTARSGMEIIAKERVNCFEENFVAGKICFLN